ncbi:uncharacterized [Tachysurus ichikawai]
MPHACSVWLSQAHALLFATVSLVMGTMPHMADVTVKCCTELPVGVPGISNALMPYICLFSAQKNTRDLLQRRTAVERAGDNIYEAKRNVSPPSTNHHP